MCSEDLYHRNEFTGGPITLQFAQRTTKFRKCDRGLIGTYRRVESV